LESGLTPEFVEQALTRILPFGTSLPALGNSPLAHLPEWSDTPPIVRAQRLQLALCDAIKALGEGEWHDAAEKLFGMTPGEHGLPLMRRRSEAADALGIKVGPFRRYKEKRLIQEVAWELAAILYREWAA
jgi:hypothetical protein